MTSPVTQYTRLGRTGLQVSVPILGCMGFGDKEWHDWVLTEEQAIPILKAAWDRGINTFDTANMYSNGESERIVGQFVKQHSIPRERVVIISKIRFIVSQDDKSIIAVRPEGFKLTTQRDYINQQGLSRNAIFNQLKASLARLQTDYVDILMIHAPDPSTPYEETMETLNDIVRSGQARYIGASNIRAWQLAEMNAVAQTNGWAQFTSVQLEHSLLYRTEEVELIAYCKYKGIGITSFAPLMDGNLARPFGTKTDRTASYERRSRPKPVRESDQKIIARVQELAQKYGWNMSQIALTWSKTRVDSVVVGMTSEQRLDDNSIVGKSLTQEDIKYLEELYEFQPHRF